MTTTPTTTLNTSELYPMYPTHPLLQYTNRVSFELSNACNMHHARCPLSLETELVVLPAAVVVRTLDEIAALGYHKAIGFHVYNEPLADPRLMSFIEHAHRRLPDCTIFFSTNGLWLNQQMLDDLVDAGLRNIHVSCYSDSEARRLTALQYRISHEVERIRQLREAHLGIYEAPVIDNTLPCKAPLAEIVVARTAQVGLCCCDWKHQHVFGDLRVQTLREVLSCSLMMDTYEQLSSGIRHLDLCSRCPRQRL